MAKLYGFKFEYQNMDSSTSELYVILETTNKDYILQCYYKQKTYSINITDKINEICKMLEKMNIIEWDMINYNEPMEFFPGFYWKLNIHTDTINLYSQGFNNYPSNWNEFINILNYIGIDCFYKD